MIMLDEKLNLLRQAMNEQLDALASELEHARGAQDRASCPMCRDDAACTLHAQVDELVAARLEDARAEIEKELRKQRRAAAKETARAEKAEAELAALQRMHDSLTLTFDAHIDARTVVMETRYAANLTQLASHEAFIRGLADRLKIKLGHDASIDTVKSMVSDVIRRRS